MASLFKKKNFGAGRKNSQSQDEMKEETQAMNNTADVSMTSDQTDLSGSCSELQHVNAPSAHEGDTTPSHPIYTRSIKPPVATTPEEHADTLHQTSTEPLEKTEPVVNATELQEPSVPVSSAPLSPAHESVAGIDDQSPVGAQPTTVVTADMPQQAPLYSPTQLQNPEQVNGQVRMNPPMSFPSPDDQQPGISLPQELSLQQPQLPSPLANTATPEEQVQPQRTRTPRLDGKVTLLAVVDQELHARVKNAAKSHKVSLKTMVEMMIKTCFPAA